MMLTLRRAMRRVALNKNCISGGHDQSILSSRYSVQNSSVSVVRLSTAAFLTDGGVLNKTVSADQAEDVAKVVPWFLKNMPSAFFKQVPECIYKEHIKAISAIRSYGQADLRLRIDTKSTDDHLQTTFISNSTTTGMLADQIQQVKLPDKFDLSSVKVFSSLDNTMSLNMFSFQSSEIYNNKVAMPADAFKIFEFLDAVKSGTHNNDLSVPKYSEKLFSKEAVTAFLPNVSRSYIENVKPHRFMAHRILYDKVHDNDGTVVHIGVPASESTMGNKSAWVTIASANVLPEVMLRMTAEITAARKLDISRAHLDFMHSTANSTSDIPGNVTLLRILVTPLTDKIVDWTDDTNEFVTTLKTAFKRIKWLDRSTVELGLHKYPHLGLAKAEIITAYCAMLHGSLYKENDQAFASIKSVVQSLDSSPISMDIAASIATLFLDRFNPHMARISETVFNARTADIQHSIDKALLYDAPKQVLNKFLAAVGKTLRTNFYNDDRYALSLRVHPSVMAADKKVAPFGVFFVHGRFFNAFHCRFRDIARGGLRVLSPYNADQYALESTRQFDEVYGLAYAMQLKNKDMPEGGSKGLILVNAPAALRHSQFFILRNSVKAFTDSMLDLIVQSSVQNMVDFYGKEEHIYMNADFQIIPSDIEWMNKRAVQRGLSAPDTLMSPKSTNGFNHHSIGVSAEGMVVFLDVALREQLGINPRQEPFTVKLTGGPDGDLAGNLIRILFREYGANNCKIVGVADGFGVAEDPAGLNSEELWRLDQMCLPITHFNTTKLSHNGVLLAADSDEGIVRRNTMHFRVQADVFLPAGGRPLTINISNWHQFMVNNSVPSSPLIVEGAFMFISQEARDMLFEQGKVVAIKDSTANKCGVISISFEVASSLLLSKEEFMTHKFELVSSLLVRLREMARVEAELLFREYKKRPGSLPHISERITFAIAKVTDAITDALAEVQPQDCLFQELFPIIGDNLPTKLNELAGDRIAERYPIQYQRSAIASGLACLIVYREGVHYMEELAPEMIAEHAFAYYRADKKIQHIVRQLQSKNCGDLSVDVKPIIVDVLQKSGARASLIDTL